MSVLYFSFLLFETVGTFILWEILWIYESSGKASLSKNDWKEHWEKNTALVGICFYIQYKQIELYFSIFKNLLMNEFCKINLNFLGNTRRKTNCNYIYLILKQIQILCRNFKIFIVNTYKEKKLQDTRQTKISNNWIHIIGRQPQKYFKYHSSDNNLNWIIDWDKNKILIITAIKILNYFTKNLLSVS